MDFLEENLSKYVDEHCTPEQQELYELYRETHLKVLRPNMLTGNTQGQYLKMLCHLMKPKNVLEIGTFTGYSAICLAQGLPEDGKLTTIDINPELGYLVNKYLEKTKTANQVNCLIGNALDIIPTLETEFDLVFIDADKVNYLKYYHLVFDKVKPNGLILADNVLWYGKVVTDADDIDTIALKEFNKFVNEDERVENVLLPLRDGLMMVRKKTI